MDSTAKKQQLRNEINHSLGSLVSSQCIILDAPDYHNIGDVLIWKGESDFLREHKKQCLYTASYETCTFPRIDKDVTIMFNGGGNLGDFYPEHMNFLQKVVMSYPDNKIVVCPQTVYYVDKLRMEKDFHILLSHKDLYFCGRDKVTYELLEKYFKNHALLVPDMAFCISEQELGKYKLAETKRKLTIRRSDCETPKCTGKPFSVDGHVSDWPTFEHSIYSTTFLNKIFKRIADAHVPLVTRFSNRLWDNYFLYYFSKAMLKEGVRFVSPYHIVETMRLHGCILSILLGKDVILIDNSYGKNSNFYDTWLFDIDNVTLKSR